MLSDVDFVQLKKQKMALEIQLLEENILAQKERSKLELQLLTAQVTESKSRTAAYDAFTSLLHQQGPSSFLKLFSKSEP